MALDLPLPRNVLVHGHWTMNREKMSKSTGNVVNPFFAIERFGVDGMRFFLAYRGGLSDDADFDNSFITRDYKKLLQNGIGNLAQRTIGCARGNLRSYIKDAQSDKLPAATAEDLEHQSVLAETPTKVAELMETLNPRAALQEIMSIIDQVRCDRPPHGLVLTRLDQQVLPCYGAVEKSRTPTGPLQRGRIAADLWHFIATVHARQVS